MSIEEGFGGEGDLNSCDWTDIGQVVREGWPFELTAIVVTAALDKGDTAINHGVDGTEPVREVGVGFEISIGD